MGLFDWLATLWSWFSSVGEWVVDSVNSLYEVAQFPEFLAPFIIVGILAILLKALWSVLPFV